MGHAVGAVSRRAGRCAEPSSGGVLAVEDGHRHHALAIRRPRHQPAGDVDRNGFVAGGDFPGTLSSVRSRVRMSLSRRPFARGSSRGKGKKRKAPSPIIIRKEPTEAQRIGLLVRSRWRVPRRWRAPWDVTIRGKGRSCARGARGKSTINPMIDQDQPAGLVRHEFGPVLRGWRIGDGPPIMMRRILLAPPAFVSARKKERHRPLPTS